ncbi:MAG: prepilin peptidase [Nitrospira sp.]|nr:prepilin peptidase [Nitrospira sp.]
MFASTDCRVKSPWHGPSSHCPSCGKPIASYDNIPIVSYLILWGRCRTCGVPIAIRYPLVEAANALGYLMIFGMFGFSCEAYVYAGLFSALIVITGTDLSRLISRFPMR